jgi:hypothetical protein
VNGNPPISENGIDKPNQGRQEDVIGAIGAIDGSEGSRENFCPHGTGEPETCDDCDIKRRLGRPPPDPPPRTTTPGSGSNVTVEEILVSLEEAGVTLTQVHRPLRRRRRGLQLH